MTKTIAAAVHAVDPQIALAEPRTLDEVKSLMLADDRFTMSLYVAFAIVALLLAAIGSMALWRSPWRSANTNWDCAWLWAPAAATSSSWF